MSNIPEEAGMLILLLLAGCASAPPGTRFANPNCIQHCVVEVIDTTGSPALSTMTATQGSTTTTTGRSTTVGGP